MIFSRPLPLHDRGDRVARIDRPEQVHLGDKLQERRIETAGLCIDGPAAISARIRDQDINSAPLLDDPRYHCFDRLAITDIDLDS
jgi:hypothetical protein